MSLINKIQRTLSNMEKAVSLSEFQRYLTEFLAIPENSLLDIIKSQYDHITTIIVKEIINFNSSLFITALMDFKDKNSTIWNETLIILKKTLQKISLDNLETTLDIFLEYHTQLLSEIHLKENSLRFERICDIYQLLFEKGIIDEEYVIKNEYTLLQAISKWERIDGLPKKGVNLLQRFFPQRIYSYNNFNSEIKKNFFEISQKRISLLEEYEQVKEAINSSEYEYQSVKILCLIRKDDKWRIPLIQAKFCDENPTDWTSMLTCTPERFRLYSKVFLSRKYWIWLDKIFKFFEVQIADLVIKLNFNNVRFSKSQEINSNNDLYVNPEYAAEFYSIRLDSNLGYDIGSDQRMRIGRNPYETIEEIIKEEFNYNVKSTDTNWGHLIIFLPKFHTRIQKITYTYNKWNIYLLSSKTHSLSDYDLYYILKDEKGGVIDRGLKEGSTIHDSIFTIQVPLNMWEIWCELDYRNKTVDWYEKVKDEIEMDLFTEVLHEINENIPASSRLSLTELHDMVLYMEQFTVLSNINKAVEVFVSPFRPIDVSSRLFCLTELSERFETFLKKLHEDSTDKNIQSSDKNLRMTTLTGILRTDNIFSSEKWFHNYNSNRNLVRANTSTEFNQNWETLCKNKKGFNSELVYVMMTTLCRNISAHLNWNTKVWIMFEPFQNTIEMIIASYLIAWRHKKF